MFGCSDKISWPKATKEESILFIVPEDLMFIMAGKVRWQEQEAERSHLNLTQEGENTSRKQGELMTLKARPQWWNFHSMAASPKGSITSPNSTTHWGASVQTDEPVGDISFKPPQTPSQKQKLNGNDHI